MSRKWKGSRVAAILLLVLAVLLSSCGTPAAPTPLPPQVVTKVETRIVEKQVTVVVPTTPVPAAAQPCPTQAPIPVGYHLVKDGELGKVDETPRILIESAFGAELEAFKAEAKIDKVILINNRSVYLGTLEGNNVAMTLSGTSMTNAAMSSQALIDYLNIERIVFSGISGGVSPERNIGDVVVPARWCEYQEFFFARETEPGVFTPPSWFSTKAPTNDFGMMFPEGVFITSEDNEPDKETEYVWFPVDEEMLSVARRSVANLTLEKCAAEGQCLDHTPVVKVGGSGVSGPTFVDNAKFREYVWNTWNPESLEMESAAVAHVATAKSKRIPFLIFRSLSDLAGGGPGENEIGTFFGVAAKNSATVMLAFLEGWANRASLPPESKLKVAYVYVGPVGDMGWSYAHDQGRLAMMKNLPYVETTIVESVPEGPDAERVLRDLAKNNDVVFATSFGYMDSVLAVAKDFPNVVFEHCTGYMTSDNVGIYDGRGYQGWFLAGMTAGKMTKKNVLGYIAPYPIPEVVRNMNAFTLGARSVNPNVKVHIVWINAWFDPTKEREAAQALIDQGVDVVARESDSAEPDKLCEQAGVYAIGYNADSTKLAPKAVLTAPVFDWGVYYTKAIQAIHNGIWDNTPYWGTMTDGVVKLGPFGQMVPQAVRDLVLAKQNEILAGAFDVFVGPIKDTTGKERVSAGVTMSDPDKLSFNWLVEGVMGSIPQ